MVLAKNQSRTKFWSNFAGLEVSFFCKKPSQSRILTTVEIGEKASLARKKNALSWSLAKSRLDHSIPLPENWSRIRLIAAQVSSLTLSSRFFLQSCLYLFEITKMAYIELMSTFCQRHLQRYVCRWFLSL